MQLSDLHIDDTPFHSNNPLLSSIISDKERYQTEDVVVSIPDILIVCGDIVGKPEQNPDFDSSILGIERQYKKAGDFLNQLCEKIFNGDKNRIIIIPGNHDISWPHSQKSMEKIDKLDKEFGILCQTVEGGIRWNLSDHHYYKIKDLNIYNQRFLPFSKFYSAFYNDERKYSLNPEEQYDFFEFPQHKLLFVGFNSCYFNDHLNRIGKIHPDCMANCHSIINKKEYNDWLKIAIWHHGIHGKPEKPDFMDDGTIHFLIDKGFQLGLHGHQHKSDICEVKFNAEQKLKMVILGCGTLCVSQQDIPPGETRQYNIVELDNSLSNVRLHIRKTIEQTDGLPIFMPENIRQNSGERYWDIPLKAHKLNSPKINAQKRPKIFAAIIKVLHSKFSIINLFVRKESKMSTSPDLLKELEAVDGFIAGKEYKLALKKLETMPAEHSIVRRFKIECFGQLNMDVECIEVIKTPSNIVEFTYLTEALWRQKKFHDLRMLLNTAKNNTNFVNLEQFKRMDNKLRDKGL